MSVLKKYHQMANHPELIGVAVSCDEDDESMTRGLVKDELHRTSLQYFAWQRVFYGQSKSKIEACNADVAAVDYPWDIIMLVSDDMVPQIKGYDDLIRTQMLAKFPDTDGILWFNDGYQKDNLNTLSIMGRKMYDSFGYIYHPSYKSFYCDTEFSDLCKGAMKDKCTYIPYCIIRHEHPGLGYKPHDTLYNSNQRWWSTDLHTYIARKTYQYDWSILIPTIPGRELKLQTLIRTIHELHQSICPTLRIDINVYFDNRELSIGAKRQALLQGAKGKYMSFIDDDDLVLPPYFEDAAACIAQEFDVCRLRGKIGDYTFTHSIVTKLDSKMAEGDVFTRPPNHLNVILTDVAKCVQFGDAFRGEDFDWAIKLSKTGYLKSEYTSDPSRIHYIYDIGDRSLPPNAIERQRLITSEDMLRAVWSPNGHVVPRKDQPVSTTRFKLGPRGFVF
jgi:glycosyltransferase involved in cell wall biosynthesis